LLEVVNEQAEVLPWEGRVCAVHILRIFVELWEKMKKDVPLDLDLVSRLLRDDTLFLVTDGLSSIRLIALMSCSTTRRMSRRSSDLMST
jgi:hypothetical protein